MNSASVDAFLTRAFAAIRKHYRNIFSLAEIESSSILQWSFGAVLFFYFLTFQEWIGWSGITVETAERGRSVCWPYFQTCYKLYFLQNLPNDYSQSELYMALYAVMLAIVYLMWKRDWVFAHALMVLLLLWKLFVVFVLSYLIAGPYDYFHLTFSFILLFLPFKEYFLKLSFVLLYFLSASSKFSPAWVLGGYFTSLQTGLPLFPYFSIPFFTNLVIFMQVIGAWFLMSSRMLLQRTIFAFFLVFHLYSGILVYYHYPSVSLPLLLILFGPLYRHTPIPFARKSMGGWLFMAILFAFQIPGYIIQGDQKLTLEGNRYGMFMFEANHQCIATVKTYRALNGEKVTPSEKTFNCSGQICHVSQKIYTEKDTKVVEDRYETGAAWNRCDPYVQWTPLKRQCEGDPSISRIALTFDHSINGGPFYRIVDEQNVCELAYHPFTHNAWIHLPPEAPIVGYPIKDEYRY